MRREVRTSLEHEPSARLQSGKGEGEGHNTRHQPPSTSIIFLTSRNTRLVFLGERITKFDKII